MKKISDWVKEQWAKSAGGKATVIGVVCAVAAVVGFLFFKLGKKKGRWS